jgi:hypothetical protein
MSVNVAVRVRPFNQREIDLGSIPCISMKDYTTIIKDEQSEDRTFTFDNSFWSHNGYQMSNGKLV